MTGQFAAAIRDIRQGLRRFELWTSLAQDDLRQRYRRTLFGLAWLTLSYLVFIVAKIFIFGAINAAPLPWFAAYVTVGFLVWQLVSAFVVDGCTSLINSETWVKGVRLPYSTYFFESVARDVVIFVYSAAVAVAVLLLTGHFPGLVAISSLAGILLIIVNGVFLQMLLGIICLRYRDVAQIVQTGMRVLFFLTPLVWTPDQVGPLADFLIWNPFTYYIDIVRAPLIDLEIPMMSWLISICLTLVLAVLSLSVFSVFRRRIPYWF